jgi:hypothetical protein
MGRYVRGEQTWIAVDGSDESPQVTTFIQKTRRIQKKSWVTSNQCRDRRDKDDPDRSRLRQPNLTSLSDSHRLVLLSITYP